MAAPQVTINPHSAPSVSPIALIANLWRNRQITLQMSMREIRGRYKGSTLGIAWSLLTPILMLIVYTFVFSEIFKAKWGDADASQSKAQFAVILFTGVIVLNFFCEIISRAPTTIIENSNFVKKVIFPIEILPLVAIISALFNSTTNIIVLLAALLIFNGSIPWTALFIPLVILPLAVLALGLSWLLAALGVFIRDIGQAINILTALLMFLSPVFYPLSAVPEFFRNVLLLNPLTFIIEQSRAVLIWGNPPNWDGLFIYYTAALTVAFIGYAWFQKTRKGFADVL